MTDAEDTDHEVTDEQWERVRAILPGQRGRGRPWVQHRPMLNGILWALRHGGSWRRMPERYGKWQTAYYRYRRWQREGLWDKIRECIDAAGSNDGADLSNTLHRRS